MTCREIAESIDIFALGSLDRDEAAQVAQHLQACPACRGEADRARRTVELLPLAARSWEPSPALKTRLLRAVGAPQQKPHEIAQQRGLAWPALRFPHLSGLTRRLLAPAIVLASLMVTVSALWWAVGIRGRLDRLQAELQQRNEMVALMGAPGMAERALAGTNAAPAASGKLYAAPATARAALVAWGLPSLPPDKAYQLWLIDPSGTRTSGGVFTVGSDGLAMHIVRAPRPLSSYQGVGITIEPSGGSPGPAGARVLGGTL